MFSGRYHARKDTESKEADACTIQIELVVETVHQFNFVITDWIAAVMKEIKKHA